MYTLRFEDGRSLLTPCQGWEGINHELPRQIQFCIGDARCFRGSCHNHPCAVVSGPLRVANVRNNVYWAEGGAGVNTGFIVGTTGVIVVDAKTTVESQKEVLAEIRKITPNPVTTVIITHSDHIKGISAFPAEVTIIAQENCKKEMETSTSVMPHRLIVFPQRRLPTMKP